MKIKGFSIPRYRKYYKKFYNYLSSCEDETLSYDNILRIAHDLEDILPSRKEEISEKRRRFITQVLSAFNHEELDNDNINTLCIILAGNMDEMEESPVYKRWTYRDDPVYTALYFNTVEPAVPMKMYSCTMDFYKGSPAGTRLPLLLPKGYLQFVIREAGGKRFEDYNTTDAGGLWISGRLEVQGSRAVVNTPYVTASQEKHNKNILEKRKQKCFLGKYNRKCFNCPEGRSSCYLSRHSAPYKRGMCKNKDIGEHEGIITGNGYCLECLERSKIESKKK